MAKWRPFEIKTIKPKGILSNKKVRTNILNALDEQGRVGVQYMYYTVEYWKGPPTFGYSVRYAGGDIRLIMYPEKGGSSINAAGEQVENYKKWYWLNYGTSVRYAHTRRGWRSKTKVPGSVGTNSAGFYTGVYLSWPIIPGIEARRWDIVIRRLMRRDFTKSIQTAIRKGTS
jgi:hypothetical protein